MTVTHTLNNTYTGGGVSPLQATETRTGQSEVNFDTTAGASATTTLSPPVVMDPDGAIGMCIFVASGNCTLNFDATSGSDVSVALTANQPFIRSTGLGLAGLPTTSDTYTLKVWNAGSTSITFQGRILVS